MKRWTLFEAKVFPFLTRLFERESTDFFIQGRASFFCYMEVQAWERQQLLVSSENHANPPRTCADMDVIEGVAERFNKPLFQITCGMCTVTSCVQVIYKIHIG